MNDTNEGGHPLSFENRLSRELNERTSKWHIEDWTAIWTVRDCRRRESGRVDGVTTNEHGQEFICEGNMTS